MVKRKYKRRQSPAQMRAFAHNSYIGHSVMMQKQTLLMIEGDTTTARQEALAARINTLAVELEQELRAERMEENVQGEFGV